MTLRDDIAYKLITFANRVEGHPRLNDRVADVEYMTNWLMSEFRVAIEAALDAVLTGEHSGEQFQPEPTETTPP